MANGSSVEVAVGGGKSGICRASENSIPDANVTRNPHADKCGNRHERNDFARVVGQRYSRIFTEHIKRGSNLAEPDKFNPRLLENRRWQDGNNPRALRNVEHD